MIAKPEQSPSESGSSGFRIEETGTSTGGKLYITVAGRERRIYNEAFEAWLINDGHDVGEASPRIEIAD